MLYGYSIYMVMIVVCTACPDHCQQCTVNAGSGATECNRNKCDNGYGLKEGDKTCSSTHTNLFIRVLFCACVSPVDASSLYRPKGSQL